LCALLPRGALPKTSSGKVQRYAARAGVEGGTLDALLVWRNTSPAELPDAVAVEACPPPPEEHPPTPRGEGARPVLLDWLSRRLGVPAVSLDRHAPFERYGLGSRDAVTLSGVLAEWLGRSVPPTIAYTHPTVEALAAHLARNGAAIPAGVAAPREA